MSLNLRQKENRIIFYLTVPLFISALFLLFVNNSYFAFGNEADTRDTRVEKGKYQETETIYQGVECGDGSCFDTGKKLFSFFGEDADCEAKETEGERTGCYARYSQPSYTCEELSDPEKRQACFDKYPGPVYKYYQGGPGTLVNKKMITVDGRRTYFNGFECKNQHIIMTGTDEISNGAMILRSSSRDVQFGNNIDLDAEIANLLINSEEGGVYFGSHVKFGDTEYESEPLHKVIIRGDDVRGQLEYTKTIKGHGVTEYNNFNGLNLNRCNDLKVNANGENLMTIPGINRTNALARTEIEKGLEVYGDINTDFVWFAGHRLYWTPSIRGNFILYYTPEPTVESGACTPSQYVR